MLSQIIAVALGGAIGASARYLVFHALESLHFRTVPWATFAVNLIGCAVAGLLFALIERRSWPESARQFVFAGILGGFTTFSSFALDVLRLIQEKRSLEAAAYTLLSVTLGLGVCGACYALAARFAGTAQTPS